MIRRAIDNLLMNALKFSVRPGVIRITLLHSDDHMELSIENKGMPITKEQASGYSTAFTKLTMPVPFRESSLVPVLGFP